MKVTVSRAQLASLIRKIQSIVPPKPSVPVISNVLLEAKDGKLTLSATDLSLSMKASMQCDVAEEGSIALPGKKFFPLVSELTAPTLEITSSAKTATLTCGGSKFKLVGIPKEEFPEIPSFPESSSLSLPATLLKDLLFKTSFAASSENETRAVLRSVLFQSENSVITTTGTDGKKLAKISIEIPTATDFPQGSFILPIKTVQEMIRLLDSKEDKESVQIHLTEDKISLQIPQITLTSKLMAGQYPDVSRIIPTEKRNPVSLHREELISLLRQISLFTSEEGASVRFMLTPGSLILSTMNSTTGEGDVNMPVNYQGEPIQIAFNPNYFLEILRHSSDESVSFDVVDSYNPGLITDSSKAIFVLMPMRIES
jgi:DNA polymerase-3 subunit beta